MFDHQSCKICAQRPRFLQQPVCIHAQLSFFFFFLPPLSPFSVDTSRFHFASLRGVFPEKMEKSHVHRACRGALCTCVPVTRSWQPRWERSRSAPARICHISPGLCLISLNHSCYFYSQLLSGWLYALLLRVSGVSFRR